MLLSHFMEASEGSAKVIHLSLRAQSDQENRKLRRNSGARVEDYIVVSSRATGKVALVPFVQRGNESSSENRDVGPANGPLSTVLQWQCRAPGSKQEDAQKSVSEDVATLA